MKNILLVAKAASSANDAVARAAIECGRGLRHAATNHDAFEMLSEGVDDIEVVILDADEGVHRLSVLDAISYPETAPPIIVAIDSHEIDSAEMAYRHGATACIPKPFAPRELAALINDVCLPDWQRTGGPCDRWGHPECDKRKARTHIGHSYDRLHGMSM